MRIVARVPHHRLEIALRARACNTTLVVNPSDDPLAPATLSPYAAQLQAGLHRLRFEPALECEYQEAELPLLRQRMVWSSLLAVLIWLGFSLLDFWRVPSFASPSPGYVVAVQLHLVRAGVLALLLVVGVMAWLVQGAWKFSILQAVYMLGAMALAMGAAWTVAAYGRMGLPDEPSVLVVLMLAVFMPIGLSLRHQLLTGVVFVVAVQSLALVTPEPSVQAEMSRMTLVLALALLVLSFGAYWREYLRREQFLLRAEAQSLAMRDALTGLFNRRMFHHHLELAMSQAGREGKPLALVLVDIDHFKLYNDSLGHPAGDRILQQIAQVLQRFAARPLDMAVRTGGEEFALVLFDCDAAHAHRKSLELVQAVRALALVHPGSPVAAVVTVSVGHAAYVPGEQVRELYARADRALYVAKAAGRNGVHGEQGIHLVSG